MSPQKQGSVINVEEMEDLLAEFEQDDSDEETKCKVVLAKFDSTEEINAEFQPMGYGSKNNQVYPDEEVLDYYEGSDDDELDMLDEDDLDDLPTPPPQLGGGLLRRNNAAIFMPIRIPCLYG